MSKSKDVKTSYDEPSFTILDAFFSFVSLCTFVADVVTDAMIVVLYVSKGHYAWAAITISLLLLCSLVIHFFSLRWYVMDGQASRKLCLINFLQLGVIHRYIELLRKGFWLRREKDPYALQEYYQRHSDVCMLRLFECFLESAPQVVLQIYIMFSTDDWNLLTEISAAVSVLSLAGGIASYNKSIRNATPHKERLSWLGLFLQFLWRAGTLTSRIIALVICASVLKSWFLILIVCHWLVMTTWVILQKTDFCATWWEERVYNCVVGVIYCFCFFNLKDGRSRYRTTTFYTIMFLENICFSVIYYWLGQPGPVLTVVLFMTVILSFAVGISSMLIYYGWFHPRGPVFIGSLISLSLISDRMSQKGHIGDFLHLRTLKFSCPDKILSTNSTPNKMKKEVNEEQNLDDFKVESLIASKAGLLAYADENPVLKCWGMEDHSYHSLDCLVFPDSVFDEVRSAIPYITSGQSFQGMGIRQLPANHNRMINYSFRPRVNNAELFLQEIHCSTLVLHEKNAT